VDINGELTWNQHWLRTARSTTRNIKLQKVVRRFSGSFALRPACGGRMSGGSWPSATYSSYHDFIRTTGAEPLYWLWSWIPIDDVNEAVGQVFTAIRGIVKANLSVDRANEVFDEMRRVADWIQQKSDGA
jgi:hypothetical protein